MNEQEAYQLAKDIHDAALPDLELFNVLEGGLPDEPRRWAVRCKYTGPDKWYNEQGILHGWNLAIMDREVWEHFKDILVKGQGDAS